MYTLVGKFATVQRNILNLHNNFKVKKRTDFNNLSLRPHNIQHAMTDIAMAIAYAIRTTMWLSIKNVFDAVNKQIGKTSKSSLYRFLCAKILISSQKNNGKQKKNLENITPDFCTLT
jgi:hypothetical protein